MGQPRELAAAADDGSRAQKPDGDNRDDNDQYPRQQLAPRA
jgi:hypothetical protein